ncbi:MAG: septal ring lytic transglycosylase RlpA family protein [Gaiellaceae bacterium]
MNAPLAQREIALAGVALLAVVLAVALTRPGADGEAAGPAREPAAEWYRALAAPYSFPPGAKRTACGQPAGPKTLGLAHPVLPCGAKIVILFDGKQVLTQVVDRGAGLPGREFDVTPGLAEEIDLTGIQPVQWRFATPDPTA